ncbi:uncharacterized protein A1O5_04357 [Cladophialophora psammophila CBS 110553]|uniref:L-ornithine N(5)-monooxygenase n=1 Tax=Cladophialophora psammophila CBS 110553 TaxID=1182543 RepID=W9X4M9_9EURO|nr:uncharacterized protein A1O5_04357 [Cladophialophora psammophila CBS 110553]EXJ71856.1 hypothetical protein A1O5_04357 [Cladophialophora psammophila CBS 110553]
MQLRKGIEDYEQRGPAANGTAIPNGMSGVNGITNEFNGIHPKAHASSSITEPEKLDVLIVGAGFAGIYLLYNLRRRNFNVKIVEMATDLGGVWYWNRYPGARADTHYPLYALSLSEVYRDWVWKSHYPDSEELREYFAHAGRVLGTKKDTYFSTKVTDAEWDEHHNLWTIQCDTGKVFEANYFIASIGFAAKPYIPDWEGLETFKGVIHHSSFWPKEGCDVNGKRVGVLGSGSTGIQIAQEWAHQIGEKGDLKMFQRTPNLCLPMNNVVLTPDQQAEDKLRYPEIFDNRWKTQGGFSYQPRKEKMLDATPEERDALFEELWKMGGFRFLMNNYSDMMKDFTANREAYNFWRRKTLQRIRDPRNRKLFAPEQPPHPFGGKRLALEVDFYEQFERPNVNVIDIKTHPIVRLEPTGLVTSDGTLHELDVIAVATGFDGITGGLNNINIRGRGGGLLRAKWNDGVLTYLGMLSAGFPNFFFTFGPQAPTAFSNGPTCIELQADWLVETLVYLRDNGCKSIDVRPEMEVEWKKTVVQFSETGVRHHTRSWWNGANIPGKVHEPLNWGGGIPLYLKIVNEIKETGYKDFEVR